MSMMTLLLNTSLALVLQVSSAVAGSAPESSYILGPNDRIALRCLNAEEVSSAPIRIDADGHVTLPFVGRIMLAGLTVSDAEKELTDQFSKFIKHPEVELTVVESHSQPVSIFGAVRNPGAYQLEGRKTLTEVLAMAGGLRPDAGDTLKLTRRKEWGPISYPSAVQQTTGDVTVAEISIDELVRGRNAFVDIQMLPHDVISVSRAELIYVVGQVRKPGGFPMSGGSDFSVLQALSLAEGLNNTAAPKRAVILRKGKSGRIEVAVNLARILAGRAPDTPLQAEDVLFIPDNAAKTAGMRTLDTILQTATGMAIYGRF
jgi:polysaccharide biosynthesis/export protein